MLGAVDDAGSKQQTNCDAELVACDQSTTDFAGALRKKRMSASASLESLRVPQPMAQASSSSLTLGSGWPTHNFRHVQNDDGGLETDTQTSNKTTSNDCTESRRVGRGSDLDNDTTDVDQATDDDSPLAANELGDISSNDGSEEGTGRQDRGDQRQVGIGEGSGRGTLDSLVEGRRARDTVDVTRVITEEDTTERGKGADDIRLPGDGGLNAFDIAGRVQASSRNDRVVAAVLLVGRHDGRGRGRWTFPPLVFGCGGVFLPLLGYTRVSLTLTWATLKIWKVGVWKRRKYWNEVGKQADDALQREGGDGI